MVMRKFFPVALGVAGALLCLSNIVPARADDAADRQRQQAIEDEKHRLQIREQQRLDEQRIEELRKKQREEAERLDRRRYDCCVKDERFTRRPGETPDEYAKRIDDRQRAEERAEENRLQRLREQRLADEEAEKRRQYNAALHGCESVDESARKACLGAVDEKFGNTK